MCNPLTLQLMKTRYAFLPLLLIGLMIQSAWAQQDDDASDKDKNTITVKRFRSPRGNVIIHRGDDDRTVEVIRSDDDGHTTIIVNGDTLKADDDFVWFDGDYLRHRFSPQIAPGSRSLYFSDDDLHFGEDFALDLDAPPFFDGDFTFNLDGNDGALGNLFLNRSSNKINQKEAEARTLARKARTLEGDERVKAEQELETLLGEIFDMKQETREERIKRMTERLSKEREALSERENARTEMIERRKKSLLGERDPLAW